MTKIDTTKFLSAAEYAAIAANKKTPVVPHTRAVFFATDTAIYQVSDDAIETHLPAPHTKEQYMDLFYSIIYSQEMLELKVWFVNKEIPVVDLFVRNGALSAYSQATNYVSRVLRMMPNDIVSVEIIANRTSFAG